MGFWLKSSHPNRNDRECLCCCITQSSVISLTIRLPVLYQILAILIEIQMMVPLQCKKDTQERYHRRNLNDTDIPFGVFPPAKKTENLWKRESFTTKKKCDKRIYHPFIWALFNGSKAACEEIVRSHSIPGWYQPCSQSCWLTSSFVLFQQEREIMRGGCSVRQETK